MRRRRRVAGAVLTAAIAPISQTVQQPTYRAALVFKPNQHGSVYFDYGTSFNPSAESLSLSVVEQLLPPEENETFEAGRSTACCASRLHAGGRVVPYRRRTTRARRTRRTRTTLCWRATSWCRVCRRARSAGWVAGRTWCWGMRIWTAQVTVLAAVPDFDWVSAGERAAADVQCVCDAQPVCAVEGGVGRELCGEPRRRARRCRMCRRRMGRLTTYTTAAWGAGAWGIQVLSTAMKQVPGYWVFNAMVKRPVTDQH